MKLTRDISKPIFHNLIFISVIFFSIWAFLLLRFKPDAQFTLILAVATFYFLWAVVYHLHRRDLTKNILIEYALYAAIAVVVAFIILFGR